MRSSQLVLNLIRCCIHVDIGTTIKTNTVVEEIFSGFQRKNETSKKHFLYIGKTNSLNFKCDINIYKYLAGYFSNLRCFHNSIAPRWETL